MKTVWKIENAKEEDVIALSELIALKIRTSDVLKLHGQLGAGKTTFARALIRSVLAEPEAEVPSPTFSLVQTYQASRLNLSHIDLYRLSNESEIKELSLDDLVGSSALILEWPEKSKKNLGENSLDITFSEVPNPELRNITLEAQGLWIERLERLKQISNFITKLELPEKPRVLYLQGDASARAYARLVAKKESYILMDWPAQPDGAPIKGGPSYSKIAHLAESTVNFQSIAELLETENLHVPKIFAADHSLGLLLLEDLGDRVFGAEVVSGKELTPMWQAATDVLLEMRKISKSRIFQWNEKKRGYPPIQDYDFEAYKIEIELLPDWYWPLIKKQKISDEERQIFELLWKDVINRILNAPSRCLTLRDFHSPNLLWLSDAGTQSQDKVGLLDFQDALIGHPAFDLVSLLQDARLDVPPNVEYELYNYYISRAAAHDPSFDKSAFLFNYAALGAQRNTKILGIFARLSKRDNKPQYLKHIPRIWTYLEKNLQHPELSELKKWYMKHFSYLERTLQA
ncbi:MAG: tRNA (adenosine(37)-N6)-threonylcarbamoyltransferase complex ATPase subunit type 1 TsaE [Hyphomicrobium sp.]